jgi:hypothetical protein
MKSPFATIAVLILLGTGVLWYGNTRGADSEWTPVSMAYPGQGLIVEDTFRLYRGGRFQLQVESPITSNEMQTIEGQSLSTNLHVTLIGSRFRSSASIHSLHAGSWTRNSAQYSPEDVWTLPPGEYEFTATGGQVPAVFSQRGAVLHLHRLEPVGPGIAIEMVSWIGYILLLWAFIQASVVGFVRGRS